MDVGLEGTWLSEYVFRDFRRAAGDDSPMSRRKDFLAYLDILYYTVLKDDLYVFYVLLHSRFISWRSPAGFYN